MLGENVAENNLKIIKSKNELKNIESANVILNKNITLLRPIIITLNKKFLKDGKKVSLRNGKDKALQISNNEIIQDQRPTTRKKLDVDKVNRLIKLLCLAGVIRKVGLNELNYLLVKKFTHDEKSRIEACKEEPIYQILGLRASHFERLKKLNLETELKYPAIFEIYGKEVADNCFNRPYATNGKIKKTLAIKLIINRYMQERTIMKLSDFLNFFSNFEYVYDSKGHQKKHSYAWWISVIRCEFELGYFENVNLKLCKVSDLKKSIKKELPWHGRSLVIVRIK